MKPELVNGGITAETQRYGIEYGRNQIVKIIDEFYTREEVVQIPTPKLLGTFDKLCEENGYPLFFHRTLGKVLREHFNLTRKKVRWGDKLFWVYIPSEKEENNL